MSKKRILIVDDEPDIRAIVKAALSVKYEVVEAVDGLDALEKLELAEPDFVVLDIMMPMMDGFQTCAAIRKHPDFKDISVLFLSALTSKEDMKHGYEVGASLYLTKPFDPQRLLRNVDLFFETNTPPLRPNRYTIEEIKEFEKQGAQALAAARAAKRGGGSAPQPAQQKPAPPARPTAPAAPPPAAQASEPLPEKGPGSWIPDNVGMTRVLVVDDDADLLQIVKMCIEQDFEVLTAMDGIEAIEKITSYQPDLIVLDAMMPKMSGFQLCQSLRRNARYAKTPMMFVSGKTTPRDRDYALRIGANDFLPKPFEPSELRAKLQGLMQLPTFRIYPKTLTYAQLQAWENRRRNDLENKQTRLLRKEETELEKFLRQHSADK
ncbi:MAG: response regulator [Candidatus Sumerlaeaceae bacterium]|nr:response regulator [Candidatus Sumerlaeaceae bacterium]